MPSCLGQFLIDYRRELALGISQQMCRCSGIDWIRQSKRIESRGVGKRATGSQPRRQNKILEELCRPKPKG